MLVQFEIGCCDLLEAPTGFVDLVEPIGGHILELLGEVFGDVDLVEEVLDVALVVSIVTLMREFGVDEAVHAVRNLVHELLLLRQ